MNVRKAVSYIDNTLAEKEHLMQNTFYSTGWSNKQSARHTGFTIHVYLANGETRRQLDVMATRVNNQI